MKLKDAEVVANEVKDWLMPYCKNLAIVGSVRRRSANPNDAELLCIPRIEHCGLLKEPGELFTNPFPKVNKLDKALQKLIRGKLLAYRLNSKGSQVYGEKNKLLTHVASGFPVDVFSTDEECWPVALVVRTGPKSSNIRIAMAAKKLGWGFNAYGSGYTKKDGSEKIICTSEREVFEFIGLEYKQPWER